MKSLLPRVTIIALLLSGTLMNTALFNTGSVGIPLFYITLPILLAAILLSFLGTIKSSQFASLKRNMVFSGIMVILSTVVVTLHICFDIGDADKELKQIFARTCLTAFCCLTLAYLVTRKKDYSNFTILTLVLILKFCIAYGIYQFVAAFLGLPFFLDFLRNSISYGQTGDPFGGWLRTYRVFSIWAEPSFSALPVALLLYFMIFHCTRKLEKLVWFTIIFVYSVCTFSRLVWLTFLFSFGFYVVNLFDGVDRLKRLKIFLERCRYLLPVLAIAGLVQWVNYSASLMEDLSSQGRSGSVIVGWHIFLDNVFLGTGMNSFLEVQDRYYNDFVSLTQKESLVQSLFVSYAQQMGIIGIIYSVTPIFYLLSMKNIPIFQRTYMALLFVVIGTFGGDCYYISLSWMVFALFEILNYNFKKTYQENIVT